MKRFGALLLATAGMLAGSGSAQACCWWLFGGWGGGYGYNAPSYGTYSAMYAPAYPVYSVSYSSGMGNNCCAPVCCDPCGCGNSCAGGACAGGACAGTTSSSGGSLKPQMDENFSAPEGTYDKSPTAKPKPEARPVAPAATTPEPAEETFTPVAPRRPATTPPDDFGSSPAEPAPFGADNEISNKPPMPEITVPANEAPAEKPDAPKPAEGSDSFMREEKPAAEGTNPQASRPGRTVIADRASDINEVLPSRRLAVKTSNSSLKGNSISHSTDSNRVRWISAPMTEGHQRL